MAAKRSVLCIAAALVSLAVTSCSPTAETATPRAPTGAVMAAAAKQPGQTNAQKVERGEGEGPSGVLVVSAELVHRCANLQALKNKPPKDETKAWLMILQSIADCMNTPAHKNDRLLLTGGSRPDAVIRYVLAKMGVSRERVDMLETTSSADDDCTTEDDCATFAVRIDIAPPHDDKEHF